MQAFVTAYALIVLLGIFLFPIVFFLCSRLHDKGYVFSKIIALLFTSYIFWILTFLHITSNSTVGSFTALILCLLCSSMLFLKEKRGIIHFFQSQKKLVLYTELLFFLSFASVSFFRSLVPEISGTEKPFEFMILNSIERSNYFPPNDAWYSGATLSYYYFGYIILDFISKLGGIASSTIFNIGISLTLALTELAAIAVGVNLLGKEMKKKITMLYLLIPLLFMGTFEGVFELLAAHGIGSKQLYTALSISDLVPYKSATWYPSNYWFFWRATRMSTNWNVLEFPFFSFLLGDLHPHVLVLPYAVTFLGLTAFLLRKVSFKKISDFLFLGFFSLLLGSIAGINTWFFPVMDTVFLFVLIITFFKDTQKTRRTFFLYLTIFLSVSFLALLFFFPLFKDSHSAISGFLPIEVLQKAQFIPDVAIRSPITQIIIFWGPLFLLTCTVVTKKIVKNLLFISVLLASSPFLFWCAWIIKKDGIGAFLQEIKVRGTSLSVEILLSLALTWWIFELLLSVWERKKVSTVFSKLCIALGFLIILCCELFYVVDIMQSRYNTVFKLYYNAWILLCVGIGIAFIAEKRTKVVKIASFIIISFSLVYSFTSLVYRVEVSGIALSLDGTKYLEKQNREELDIAKYLIQQKNVVIVESSGADYTSDNIVSAISGVPTVIGWVGTHERQMRNDYPEIAKRLLAVDQIYRSTDIYTIRRLLKRYDVSYVVVTPKEIMKYSIADQKKFLLIARVVFDENNYKVYKVN